MSEYDVTPRLGPTRDQGKGVIKRFGARRRMPIAPLREIPDASGHSQNPYRPHRHGRGLCVAIALQNS